MNPRIPPAAQAVLRALRLDAPEKPVLSEPLWDAALAFADRTQLTLALRAVLVERGWWESVPETVRRRLDQNLTDNTERLRMLEQTSTKIAERLAGARVDFVTLKGLSHSPDFVTDPRERVQYDLDLFCTREQVSRARDVLLDMGYEPMAEFDAFPIDHLPTMVRKTGWQWRGNFFDPDLPPSVDLHFRLWDQGTERLAAPGVEKFWSRRAGHQLELADRLGYAALHAVRHLLRGSLRLYHVYEIALLLKRRQNDAAFWAGWRELHPEALRRLESIAFRLAEIYFGAPRLGETLGQASENWFARFAWSPVEAIFHPNKHELVLHIGLLSSSRDRWSVLVRRLLPMRLPGPVEAVYVPEERMTLRLRLRKSARYATFLGSRVVHHARVLLPTLWALAFRRGGSR